MYYFIHINSISIYHYFNLNFHYFFGIWLFRHFKDFKQSYNFKDFNLFRNSF